MSPRAHKLYIGSFVAVTVAVLAFLIYRGFSFYQISIVDRFHHADYSQLKPSGVLGHGYGIVGSLCILIGIISYMMRKRMRAFSRWGLLKHWLEFHIFLCTIGPILILFHTSFKFGGIVAVSFWSMVAVVLSGVAGRYIYLQIPRTIEGREMSLKEVNTLKEDFRHKLATDYGIDESLLGEAENNAKGAISLIKKELTSKGLKPKDIRQAIAYFKSEKHLGDRIKRLETMQRLFRYWHVAHLPFALIMLIILFIHIAITLLFGYKWIF